MTANPFTWLSSLLFIMCKMYCTCWRRMRNVLRHVSRVVKRCARVGGACALLRHVSNVHVLAAHAHCWDTCHVTDAHYTILHTPQLILSGDIMKNKAQHPHVGGGGWGGTLTTLNLLLFSKYILFCIKYCLLNPLHRDPTQVLLYCWLRRNGVIISFWLHRQGLEIYVNLRYL